MTSLEPPCYDLGIVFRYRDVFLTVSYGARAQTAATLKQVLTLVQGSSQDPYAVALFGDEAPSTEATTGLDIFRNPSAAEAAAVFRSAALFLALEDGPELARFIRHARFWRVPVVSVAGLDLKDLLGEGIFRVETAEARHLAAVVRLFAADRHLRRTVAAAQNQPAAHGTGNLTCESLVYVVDGPFESSYSLALVNREGARALEARRPGRVALDFLARPPHQSPPDPYRADLSEDLRVLAERARRAVPVDNVLWNSYPPYVAGRPGALSVLHSYGWEETGYPEAFLRRFARCLDGVTVMSRTVRKILMDNGLPLPIRVTGLGVDHVRRTAPIPYPGDLGRSFRFLSVSSAFPRKGLDVLLEAYGRAFTGTDDVTLVLKTFPNPHNRVHELVAALGRNHPDPPHVVFIDEDLPDGMIVDLYRRCHAYVAPTRGEGFGLPMAEAMLHGLPVIVTEGSGQADFCTAETAWLVPARYAEARTHLSEPGSLWLEPDVEALAKTLRTVFEATPKETENRCVAARRFIESRFTWDGWAQRTEEAVNFFRRPHPWRHRTIPLVWVSTWGGRCGIARYSQYLLEPLLGRPGAVNVRVLAPTWETPLEDDPSFVRRCWSGPNVAEAAEREADDHRAAVAVVQYHPAFFPVEALTALIRALEARGVLVWVTFHAVRYVAEALRAQAADLAKAARLAVHTLEDVNFFKDLGLEAVTLLWPHGVPAALPLSPEEAKARFGLTGRRVLSTFGFLMPHKGVLPLLAAFRKLLGRFLDLFLLLATAQYPTEGSARHAQEVRQAIERMGLHRRVLFLTDFVEETAALTLLQASDLIVYPYQHSEESSSAAVRFGIASGRPVACTSLRIFDDVAGVVHRLPGPDPEALAQGLGELLADEEKLQSLREKQALWVARHAWPAVADRFERVLRALLINGDSDASEWA